MLLFLTVYRSFNDVLTKETDRLNRVLLEQAMQDMDRRILGAISISFQIQENPTLSHRDIVANVVSARNAIKNLKNYVAVSPGWTDILLYYLGDDLVFSASGTYPAGALFSDAFGVRLEEGESVFDGLSLIDIRSIADGSLFSEPKTSSFALTVPLPHGNPSKNALTVFLIGGEGLLEPFAGLYREEGSAVALLRGDGTVIASAYGPGARKRANAEWSGRMEDGVRLVVSRTTSDTTGWTAVSSVPASVYFRELEAIRTRSLLVLAAIAVFGMALTYGLSYLNYNPLRRLKTLTDELAGGETDGDEIAAVRRSVERLHQMSILVGRRLDENRGAIKDALSIDLLAGLFDSADSFNARAADIGLAVNAEQYVVCVFRPEAGGAGDRAALHRAAAAVETMLSPYFPSLGRLDDINEGRLVFVLFLHQGDYELIDGLMSEIRGRLAQEGYPVAVVGVGDPREKLEELRFSYEEALAAAAYRLTGDEGAVIFHSTVSASRDGRTVYPRELIATLHLHLLQLDIDKADAALDCIIAFLEEERLPLYMVRIVCFDIVTSIVKILEDLDREYGTAETERTAVERLLDFDTVREFSDLVKNLLRDAFKKAADSKDRRVNERAETFKSFIRDNYMDKNFSACLMADHFKISLSSLSHFFKARIGESISDYVNRYRMEEAKRSLRETEQPVQVIVSRLGYLSTSSFIRKFRQAEGMTPGMYRDTYKNSQAK